MRKYRSNPYEQTPEEEFTTGELRFRGRLPDGSGTPGGGTATVATQAGAIAFHGEGTAVVARIPSVSLASGVGLIRYWTAARGSLLEHFLDAGSGRCRDTRRGTGWGNPDGVSRISSGGTLSRVGGEEVIPAD